MAAATFGCPAAGNDRLGAGTTGWKGVGTTIATGGTGMRATGAEGLPLGVIGRESAALMAACGSIFRLSGVSIRFLPAAKSRQSKGRGAETGPRATMHR